MFKFAGPDGVLTFDDELTKRFLVAMALAETALKLTRPARDKASSHPGSDIEPKDPPVPLAD